MLMTKGVNWNDFPVYQRRGSCCIHVDMQNPKSLSDGDRIKGWTIDKEIPIFKGEGREYVDKLVYIGD